MNILVALLVGLIAGFLADILFKDNLGLVGDILIGLIGGVLGNIIFQALGVEIGTGLPEAIFVSFIGAAVLLLIANALNRTARA